MPLDNCLNFLMLFVAIFILIPNYIDFTTKSIMKESRSKVLVFVNLVILALCIFEISSFLIYIFLIEQKFRGVKAVFYIYPLGLLFIELLVIYYYTFYIVRRYR